MILNTPNGVLTSSLEPIRKSHYTFSFTSPQGEIFSSAKDHMHVAGGSGFEDSLTTEKFSMGNWDMEIPVQKSTIQVSVNCRFFTSKDVYKKWVEWRKKVWDDYRYQPGLFIDYVGSGKLYLYPTSSGSSTPTPPSAHAYKFELIDCYPLTVKLDDVDSEDEGTTVMGYTVILSCGSVRTLT